MIDITLLDLVLLNITSYLFGISTGLLICCKYNNNIMRLRSIDNLKQYNHQKAVNQPNWDSPVIQASAPPPIQPNPLKLTIE